MHRSILGGMFMFLAVLALVGGSKTAVQGKDKGGKPGAATGNVVAKWDWMVFDENDNLLEKGNFTARGYTIYKNGKLIGSYDEISDTHFRVEVSEGRLKGKLDLFKEDKSGINWKGELERPTGGKYKIKVSFEKFKK